MSQYTWIENATVALKNHDNPRTLEELQESRAEDRMYIERIKSKFWGLICGNIRDLLNCKDCEGEEMDPVDVAHNMFQRDWEELEELLRYDERRSIVEENWDKVQQEY